MMLQMECSKGVFQKHCYCHWTNSARYRSDHRSFFINRFKINVTTEFSVNSVNSNVDHNSAVFYHIGCNKTRFANC